MIINTGQRTDIPAFYSRWFMNRLREGYVLVRNPYNPQSVTRYTLSPDIVDIIGFCTKNPAPMLPYLQELKPYGQYWFVTITPYGKDIEPHVPDKARVIDCFLHLSEAVGIHSMGWRYDPIFLNDRYPLSFHLEAFERMAEALSGYTHAAVISFIDLYEKTRRNFPEARTVSAEDRITLGKAFVKVGQKYGMAIKACAEGDDLAPYGVDCSGCMTIPVYEQAIGCNLKVPSKAPAREACSCYLGGDIGAYNTCGHLCRYCYANYDADTVRANRKKHDPNSPMLIGNLMPGDKVHQAEEKSWKDYQLRLDLL
ncbi:MAG: DUF1848 domain-containing protein [Clostridia bacterium]|nr:DUF1848 domain-containing protein [Clostridia bacterium]MBQ9252170.1 DUF1848 domain-containing protein [Clostridia bacterium]